MADWKFLGGITALGGLIGYFGAKTIDTNKLPAGEKAVLTGASTGATMEGLDLALGAESFSADENKGYCVYCGEGSQIGIGGDYLPSCGKYVCTDIGDCYTDHLERCGVCAEIENKNWNNPNFFIWDYKKDAESHDFSQKSAESFSADSVSGLLTSLVNARKYAGEKEQGYDYQWQILNMRGHSHDIDLSMSQLESRSELMGKIGWTLSNLIDELVEESLDLSAESSSEQKFRHKKTGEIATQISLMDIKNWEKLGAESFEAPIDDKGYFSWDEVRHQPCVNCSATGFIEVEPYQVGRLWKNTILCNECMGGVYTDTSIPPSDRDYFGAESLKRDSCCCGATKSNPCACMIQGIMECSATCPCSLEN